MSRMPALLLPDTAAPYALRSRCTVVLDKTVDPWLTATLKRINRIKRPLNSVPQHMKCLTETLSQPSSVWNLCMLMVPRAPASQLDQLDNPLSDALMRYELLQVQAWVVHVDFVLANEVAFKLTKDSIEGLVEYHKEVYLIDQSEGTWEWTEKEAHIKKLHDEFVSQVNKFVFRTDATALEGLDEEGAGELLCGKSEEVKNQVLNLFLPLLPPPPRFVEPTAPMYTGTVETSHWWTPTPAAPRSSVPPPPVEAWRILPSSPIDEQHVPRTMPTSTGATYPSAVWGSLSLPAVTYGSYTTAPSMESYSTAPLLGSYSDAPSMEAAYSSAPSPQYSQPPATMPSLVPQLPLPSLVASQCSMGTTSGVNFGGFGWDRYPEYTTTM